MRKKLANNCSPFIIRFLAFSVLLGGKIRTRFSEITSCKNYARSVGYLSLKGFAWNAKKQTDSKD